MRRLSWMRREAGRLERDLRAERPEPRADYLLALTKHVDESRPRRPRAASRVAFALALTTFVVGTFASFGGISYAAAGAASAVDVVKKVVADRPQAVSGSAAQQQYGPPPSPPTLEEEQAAAGEVAQAAGAERLPFTGISLLITVVLGLALLTAGLLLRRAEKRKT